MDALHITQQELLSQYFGQILALRGKLNALRETLRSYEKENYRLNVLINSKNKLDIPGQPTGPVNPVPTPPAPKADELQAALDQVELESSSLI